MLTPDLVAEMKRVLHPHGELRANVYYAAAEKLEHHFREAGFRTKIKPFSKSNPPPNTPHWRIGENLEGRKRNIQDGAALIAWHKNK